MSHGGYVVGEGAGRRVLLLGPFPSLWDAEDWVARTRAAHRRVNPTAYGWAYRAERVAAPPGTPLPPGRLNDRLGVKLSVQEPPRLKARSGSRVRYVPYLGAEFKHTSLAGEDGGPVVCRITRHDVTTVWFRPICADGSLGDLYRCLLGQFKTVMAEWVKHPFATPETWVAAHRIIK